MRNAGEYCIQVGGAVGRDFAKEARVGFSKEQGGGCKFGIGVKAELGTKPTGKTHFSRGDGEAALAQVVAGGDEAGTDGAVNGGESGLSSHWIDFRSDAALKVVDQRVVGAAEFVVGFADEVEHVAGAFEVHGDAAGDVVDLAESAE